MLTLIAKTRKTVGKKTKTLRQKGLLPAVLYGPKIKSMPIEVNFKDFEKTYKEAGESSLLSLEVGKEKFTVLIHELSVDPLSSQPFHVDFYQPDLKKEIEAKIPIVIEGESGAVKELGGTIIKNISELEVRALPQDLPREIKIDVSSLNTFEEHIAVKDLKLQEGVKILKDPEEILVRVIPPQKIEEELAKPIEEKVEEVEKMEKKKEDSAKEGSEEKEKD